MFITALNFYFEYITSVLQKAPLIFGIISSVILPNNNIKYDFEINKQIYQTLENYDSFAENSLEKKAIKSQYKNNLFYPFWIKNHELTPKANKIFEKIILEQPEKQYFYDFISSLIKEDKPEQTAIADILTTHIFINYAAQHKYGYDTQNQTIDYKSLLSNLLKNKISYPSKEYIKLLNKIRFYRKISTDFDSLEKLPNTIKLSPSSKSSQIIKIRKKLFLLGDLKNSNFENKKFDKEFKKAVISYQKRHGLKSNAVIDKEFIDSINEPLSEKIKIMELNLSRARNSKTYDGKYIYVNIPGYVLYLKDQDKILYKSKVITGSVKRKTPIFNNQMSYIVINPAWNIPNKLVVEDFVPKFEKNPGSAKNSGIKIFSNWNNESREISPYDINWNNFDLEKSPYRFTQIPGPSNSLGEIKFMFPNEHSIYIHGTPHKSLFRRDVRALSSGCIRLPKPIELADLLLKDYTAKRIKDVINTRHKRIIRLDKKIPVTINYVTSWVDDNGTVNIRPDIYGYDHKALEETTIAKENYLRHTKEYLAYLLMQIEFGKIKSETNKHLGFLSPFPWLEFNKTKSLKN